MEAVTEVKVRRLTIAVDAGRAIDPDGAENQVEGGAIQATSWTLKERVRFDRLTVTSDTWDSYPILRFSEVPAVEVELSPGHENPPLGVGETAQGPTAAAIANAFCDALGVRAHTAAHRAADPRRDAGLPGRTAHAVDHDGTMSAVQWGSVSTWVAGVGTVAAVSLALWEARGERKERLRRELRQQAERISAWFVGMHKDPDGEDPDGGNPDGEDSHRDAWLPPELRGRVADVELLNNSENR